MLNNNDFEQINKKICKAMRTDLNDIGLAFYRGESAMDLSEMHSFCKWWVKKYPDKYANLKGGLYQYRADKAKLLHSIDVILKKYVESKSNPFVILQIQMLVNNSIDQMNATCQLVQLITKMCERSLSEED